MTAPACAGTRSPVSSYTNAMDSTQTAAELGKYLRVAFCQAEQVDRDRFPKYGQHVLQTYLRALIDSAQVTQGHCPVCGEDVSGRVDRLRGGGAAPGGC